MANTNIDLGLTPLTGQDARNGYNVFHRLDWKQLVNNAPADESSGDTQTYRLVPLRRGDIVRGVYTILRTPFDSSIDAFTTLAIQVGDLNDVNGYITSQSILTGLIDSAYVGEPNGAYFTGTDNNTVSGGDTTSRVVKEKTYSYDDSAGAVTWLTATITPIGGFLGKATEGEVDIIADIIFAPR